MNRSIVGATVLAGIIALAAAIPALAGEPNRQSNEMSDWKGPEQPVRQGQEQTAALKLALKAGDTTGVAAEALAAARERTQADGSLADGAAEVATTVLRFTVPTYERQQINAYFCGPTAIQDMADYVWGMGSVAHKYTQNQISTKWTHTGTSGTGAAAELVGANGSLVGSPRDSFPYWSYQPGDGPDWSSTLQSDTVLGMPQIVNLQPWAQGSSGTWYHLPSWSDHQSTGGTGSSRTAGKATTMARRLRESGMTTGPSLTTAGQERGGCPSSTCGS